VDDGLPTEAGRAEHYDNPIERLRLIGGDDDAIAGFLDEIDIDSPREREMLSELARTTQLARAERFEVDHRHAIEALESLRRHGFHGSRAGAGLGPLRVPVRKLVQLIARYIVVSYVRNVVTTMRNLYWVREMEAPGDSYEFRVLRPARFDAQGLVEIMQSREIGVPSFIVAGLLIPVAASVWRLADGFRFDSWVVALLVGLLWVAIGLGLSWVVLRGTAMASRRIRLATHEPLNALWDSVGSCGRPPKDQSRTFAVVAITLAVGVWIVLPGLVALALAA
jgi:hypothetical protein